MSEIIERLREIASTKDADDVAENDEQQKKIPTTKVSPRLMCPIRMQCKKLSCGRPGGAFQSVEAQAKDGARTVPDSAGEPE